MPIGKRRASCLIGKYAENVVHLTQTVAIVVVSGMVIIRRFANADPGGFVRYKRGALRAAGRGLGVKGPSVSKLVIPLLLSLSLSFDY